MAPEIFKDVTSWFRGRRQGKIMHLGDTIVRGSPGYIPSDFRDKETSGRVSPDLGDMNPTNKETTGRIVPRIGTGTHTGAKAADRVLPGTGNVAPTKKETAGGMVSGMGGESPIEKQISYQSLPSTSRLAPSKGEGAAGKMVADISGESPTGKVVLGQTIPEMSSVLFTKNGDSHPVGPDVASKMVKTPRDREIHKEGYMDGAYYVARNEMESTLVRGLHPDCKVIIPSDYDKAIGEIVACPLNCPYRALEFAEIDQKMLRSRPIRPSK